MGGWGEGGIQGRTLMVTFSVFFWGGGGGVVGHNLFFFCVLFYNLQGKPLPDTGGAVGGKGW